jgi:hypothetical protein
MSVRLTPDQAFEYRKMLEPQTHNMVAYPSDGKADNPNGGEIELASIAISLKRIADVLEHMDKK